MRNIDVITDLQFGSTGKGLIAGYLAETKKPDTLVTAWAANAGHTYIDSICRKFVHTMLANGIVSPRLRQILIGPGSLVNLKSLLDEIDAAKRLGINFDGVRIGIHANAAVIQQRHRDEEADTMTGIGSTKKGVGAAAIEKIRRQRDGMITFGQLMCGHAKDTPAEIMELMPRLAGKIALLDTCEYNAWLDEGQDIQVEGAQGYSLSMHHGMYPFTTSRDVSTHQILADCGIPATSYVGGVRWGLTNIIGCCRTYPIRVANRFNESGEMVGYSGDCYPDQVETSFEAIGQQTELTTVTKLPRRIFTFSRQQIQEAIRLNGCDQVFLNFVNYVNHDEYMDEIVDAIRSTGARIAWTGHGATFNDIYQCF